MAFELCILLLIALTAGLGGLAVATTSHPLSHPVLYIIVSMMTVYLWECYKDLPAKSNATSEPDVQAAICIESPDVILAARRGARVAIEQAHIVLAAQLLKAEHDPPMTTSKISRRPARNGPLSKRGRTRQQLLEQDEKVRASKVIELEDALRQTSEKLETTTEELGKAQLATASLRGTVTILQSDSVALADTRLQNDNLAKTVRSRDRQIDQLRRSQDQTTSELAQSRKKVTKLATGFQEAMDANVELDEALTKQRESLEMTRSDNRWLWDDRTACQQAVDEANKKQKLATDDARTKKWHWAEEKAVLVGEKEYMEGRMSVLEKSNQHAIKDLRRKHEEELTALKEQCQSFFQGLVREHTDRMKEQATRFSQSFEEQVKRTGAAEEALALARGATEEIRLYFETINSMSSPVSFPPTLVNGSQSLPPQVPAAPVAPVPLGASAFGFGSNVVYPGANTANLASHQQSPAQGAQVNAVPAPQVPNGRKMKALRPRSQPANGQDVVMQPVASSSSTTTAQPAASGSGARRHRRRSVGVGGVWGDLLGVEVETDAIFILPFSLSRVDFIFS